MLQTPWGDANTLRDRRLPPGRTRPREEVRRNQRERLFAATVALCATKGYAQTTVADLTELSGVSSRSFYELFDDKEDCFLATMEEILATVQRLAERALEAGGGRVDEAHVAVETFVAMVAAQPAAARLCMVSAFSAGAAPRARIAQAVSELSALVQRSLEAMPGHGGMPVELIEAILGGVALVLYRRLAAVELDGLGGLAAPLREWVLAVPPPPRPLRPRPQRRVRTAVGAPPFAAHVPGERVLRGFAAAVAEKGYAAATIADVAARAQISQNSFYKHFRDKPEALRVALETLCGFLAAEPDFAYLREVEVYAIGPVAVGQRDRAREEIVRMLEGVAEIEAEVDPLALEATLGAFQALLYSRLRTRPPGELIDVPPLVTYLTLSPEIGAERAYEVACG